MEIDMTENKNEPDFSCMTANYSHEMSLQRKAGFRTDLYRAIYSGDIEKAEDIINMMAMVGIDRDWISAARNEVRRG